jgi:two-component system, NtrC family, nitrogen regulation response regulator GlnG
MSEPLSDSVVIVVDDEPAICWGFQRLLAGHGHRVVTASSAEEGLGVAATESNVALIILDVRLPGIDGITALPKFRDATGGAPVVVMTAFGDLETAVSAVRGGASDYLTKPFTLESASKVCLRAIRPDRGGEVLANEEVSAVTSLVGRSPAMQQVFRQIALVADSDLSVMVTGETGTGKELVAAAIHRHSKRADQPYLAIAPATLSETILESELFGHVKGAFTGAADTRAGLFQLADGGTVLLDEIGDLNRAAQVKLLRVIEQGEFTPVGDVRPRKCNVRVIAATNRDLTAAVAEGDFREDLLYRLAAVSIRVPPLRDRREDIPLLCQHFLSRLGYPNAAEAMDADLAEQLGKRNWNGNVRELRNAVEHASVIARGRPLRIDDFPISQDTLFVGHDVSPTLDRMIEKWTQSQLDAAADAPIEDLHERLLAAVEPAALKVVLQHTGGNRAAAAQLLGIHRGTLRERIKRYGDGGL